VLKLINKPTSTFMPLKFFTEVAVKRHRQKIAFAKN